MASKIKIFKGSGVMISNNLDSAIAKLENEVNEFLYELRKTNTEPKITSNLSLSDRQFIITYTVIYFSHEKPNTD